MYKGPEAVMIDCIALVCASIPCCTDANVCDCSPNDTSQVHVSVLQGFAVAGYSLGALTCEGLLGTSYCLLDTH